MQSYKKSFSEFYKRMRLTTQLYGRGYPTVWFRYVQLKICSLAMYVATYVYHKYIDNINA